MSAVVDSELLSIKGLKRMVTSVQEHVLRDSLPFSKEVYNTLVPNAEKAFERAKEIEKEIKRYQVIYFYFS